MDKKIFDEESKYLNETLQKVQNKLDNLENYEKNLDNSFNESNAEYLEYLRNNANKMNDEDFVTISQMQVGLNDLEIDSEKLEKAKVVCKKMLDKPYFARIDLQEHDNIEREKYYIGINSLKVDRDSKDFQVIDWRSPIASIFYDYEQGKCELRTNSSVLEYNLLGKRQFDISKGNLDYYIDTTINIEDEILREALAKSTTDKMKTIVQTIQKEQNQIIRGDENKTLIVQGVAGSGKTAIALHRIAYILYKMKGKWNANNIHFLSPNNAFSSYISSVLPDLAEDDVEKIQLDSIARNSLKKHLILERKYEQIERLIAGCDYEDYKYKTSYQFVLDLLEYARINYIDNFSIDSLTINNIEIDCKKIKNLFFGRYADRDLFTRIRWITDNIFDTYFGYIKKPDRIVNVKRYIFTKLYESISEKNCVKAYMNFLSSHGMSLQLVGDKVKNEDAYAILFFKYFIYGVDSKDTIKHLVVDEMQDYSALQLYLINQIYPCPKTILGDYNQTLLPESIHGNYQYFQKIFGENTQLLTLNKSYRSTKEIAEFYNSLYGNDHFDVVSRQGENVDLITIQKSDILRKLVELIDKMSGKNYNSIVIITKTNDDARRLHTMLGKKYDIQLVDDNLDEYHGGLCVMSAYNSKGLEFDSVIVFDVSENFSSEIDKNLLYIATSRALHKLTIVSVGTESNFIKNSKRG